MKQIEFDEFWADRGSYRLIDVREVDEFEQVRVKGAELHALSRIKNGDLPDEDDRAIALICKMGGRSAMAGQILEGAGFREVTNVNGGTLAAVEAGTDCVES